MPRKTEKERKLKLLSSGKNVNVRAPKKWFDKMRKEIKDEYPSYGSARISQIVAGIWNKMGIASKRNIVKKYQ